MPWNGADLLDSINAQQHQRMLAGMMVSGTAAETLAGGIMSRGAAVGAPLMSGAMGMMGLDPLSLGIRAGTAAYGSGMVGMAGAAGIGLGVAAPLAIGGIAASYAGNQMMHGAQQQMGLNQSLRSGYNFINGQGGMGFTSQQGFQIGSQIRSMTHDIGPAGEMHGFEELSKIAGNMGRMGFAQNVRTVEDFRNKFKETMETLKKVAHDIGSTLEDAMKFVQSMKGSGIFRTADQLKMSGDIRMAAVTGGIATSEVSAMANIGSQVSRSVGGLGRQGAFGGIRAIEQIGQAQRLGILSEEDVYNATGLSGAEGRQALATSQMQRSASFLRGGRGRRFLASIAGENGELNEDAVAEWMQGGVGTGRTMELAHRNLRGVGRANFIRNEGRLRGAALEQFGGMAQTMAYSQWLGSRGYDPNGMDDRAMLAFQRFSGMGRDEADAAIKQVQGLPEMLRARQEESRGLGRADELQRRRETTGIAGLEKKIDHAKHAVNSALEQAGSRILQAGQENIEKWFNEIMGIYVSSQTQGLSEVSRRLERGTGSNADAASFRRMFGTGMRTPGAGSFSAPGLSSRGGITEEQHRNFQNSQLLMGARAGSTDENVHAWAGANPESIKEATLAAMGKQGKDAVNAFQAALGPGASSLFGGNKSLEAQAGVMQAMQQDAGVASKSQIASVLSAQNRSVGLLGGGYRTEAEMLRAQGNAALGRSAEDVAAREREGGWKAALSGAAAVGTMGLSTVVGGMFEGMGVKNMFSLQGMGRDSGLLRDHTEDAYTKGIGQLFQDKGTMNTISDLYDGSAKEKRAARNRVLDQITGMRTAAGPKGLGDDQSKADYLAAISISSEDETGSLIDRAAKGEDVDLSKQIDRLKSISGNEKLSTEDARNLLLSSRTKGREVLDSKYEENRQAMIDELRDRQSSLREGLQGSGQAVMGKDGKLSLTKAFTKDGGDLDRMSTELMNLNLSSGEGLKRFYDLTQDINRDVSGRSVAERQQIARERVGTTEGMAAASSLAAEKRFSSLSKRTGSAEGAVEAMLGINVDREERETLAKLKGSDRTDYLAGKLSLDKGQREDLEGILSMKNKGLQATRLQEFTTGLDPNSSAGKALAQRREGQKDPQVALLEKIQSSAAKQEEYLKSSERRLWESADYLRQINVKTTDSPEAPPK